MADPSQLSSTLSSMASQEPQLFTQMLSATQPPAAVAPAQVHPPVNGAALGESVAPAEEQPAVAGPSTGGAELIMNGAEPPKRRPGRPKGSGKKPVDPNAPPKVKRPVGRPRKDGLPAGSLGPARATSISTRSRKAPPGQYATRADTAGPSVKWEQPNDVGLAHALSGGSSHGLPTPVLGNEWSTLLRADKNAFLHNLVLSLGPIKPAETAREAFTTHLLALKPNNGIPYLYSVVRTFWIPCSPAFFSLVTPSGIGRPVQTPDRFFYWDPLPLIVMGLPCPGACGGVLEGHGRIPHGVLAVHDIRDPFYIIGAEYVCTSEKCVAACGPEGRILSSVDGSVMRALPPGLRKEFPAHLLNTDNDRGAGEDAWNWSVCGVSNGLWDLVRSALRVSTAPAGILELIRCTRDGVPDHSSFSPPQPTPPHESISAPPMPSASMEDSMEVEAALEESTKSHKVPVSLATASAVPDRTFVHRFAPVDHSAPRVDLREEEEEGEDEIEEKDEEPETPMSVTQTPPTVPPTSSQQVTADFVQPSGPAPVFYHYNPESSLAFAMTYPTNAHAPLRHTTPGYSVMGKRPYENAFPVEPPSPVRRSRHCCKCGSGECKGKGGRSFCLNPCQDCGQRECPGRNSKRPEKTCAEAWRPGETIN